MEFFATIRKQSKYYRHQQQLDSNDKAVPFRVTIVFDSDPEWPVHGGFGGRYTLFDVDLWVVSRGRLQRIPLHKHI